MVLSPARPVHRRWLADGPGRAMAGGWFEFAAVLLDANLAGAGPPPGRPLPDSTPFTRDRTSSPAVRTEYVQKGEQIMIICACNRKPSGTSATLPRHPTIHTEGIARPCA